MSIQRSPVMPIHSRSIGRVSALVPRLIPATFALLLATPVHAESTCPDFVILPSGSVFNIAKLIADTGSPEAALRKVRGALDEIAANGGCPKSVRRAVCDETMAVARKAVVALQSCAAHGPQADGVEKDGRSASK
ncbi:hypothetical protein [Paraburkholderia hospita]|uniref:UrcA family protein n=2 Tax=Paraburkholderia hospita TaxID=169430 RepID=A0ABP2P9G9_9BURK|nr:hypothetical protein [Paraburkholderia hospita]EIM94238.1 hypothetical protein WQE_44868 [Paraburkholderia hospita]OUL74144.1 hypothetical protein CA602_39670 [Paraburkholderia hospita]OUL76610.1 hypothetical protein CA601_40715 [Paraburkholderia hospita]OUL77101.1 hypothetical protein CA603_37035 [Paraburkholderia hospita]